MFIPSLNFELTDPVTQHATVSIMPGPFWDDADFWTLEFGPDIASVEMRDFLSQGLRAGIIMVAESFHTEVI